MTKIKIVADSTADIPSSLANELGITVIPLKVIFGEEETYEDGVTLTPEQFYKKVEQSNTIPTTSQPTPYDMEKVYESLLEKDEETVIFSFHLSSKLSGTYQAATIAKQSLAHSENVHVIDSKRASYAVGIIVVEIAQMAKQGASLEECMARIDQLLEKTKVYFLVDTLDYLQKNGRIGKASALFGSLLKIKPILSLTEEGEVFPFEKVRGQKKAITRLISILKEEYGDASVHIGISHALNEQLAADVEALLLNDFDVQSSTITAIGAVIGSHVGPGTIAVTMTTAKG